MDHFKDISCPTTSKDPFTLRTILINVTMTDHVDESSWVGGLTLMSTFGEFKGADLCLRQLGMRVGFAAGSIATIGGPELFYNTTWWDGVHRCSAVHICVQFMRIWAARPDRKRKQGNGNRVAEEEVVLSSNEIESDSEKV